MELSELEIKNFKCVTSAQLALTDVNILVGGNGSGKSSIIQATHLACCVIRQASRVERTKTSTVSIEELDYLPTDNYKKLAFRGEWGNKDGSPSSEVSLTFLADHGVLNKASCELRSARNAGISIKGEVPNELTDKLRRKRNFFSAYIPGISGIPNKEEKKSQKVVRKACSYGDSNIILRNVLLLLNEQSSNNIRRIESWISQIIEPIKIQVSHDEENDLYIDCSVEISEDVRPIELLGTGYLQLIQIFSYILLFKPGILLIDEPDIHLHPVVQENLVKVFAEVAREESLRILMTTHSPFIVRGAPLGTNIFWLENGLVASQNRRQIELALGWGTFGKKIIVISEDQNIALIRKLISQWADLDKFVTFYPGTGYKSIPTPDQVVQISEALGNKYKILVHRDRDSLTDSEAQVLKEKYSTSNTALWLPQLSDIESYFCSPEFIMDLASCSGTDANSYIDAVLSSHSQPIFDQFKKHRKAHNEELYPEGGSPSNSDVWDVFQSRPLKGAKGKFVFKQLKNKVPENIFREESILAHPLRTEIATDLKQELETLLAR